MPLDEPNGEAAQWAREHGLTTVSGCWADGLGKGRLHYGETSGYQAVNLAYLRGAARIVLLGYDYQLTHGELHFFGAHTKVPQENSQWQLRVRPFERLAADLRQEGVDVINCTRHTALRCFRQGALDAVGC